MQSHPSTNYGRGLSRFLIPYLLLLLGVLMLVHVLQPQRDGPGSSSRSPVHRERESAAGHAADDPRAKMRTPAEPRSRPGLTIHPPASGAALGFDRLVMPATGTEQVIWTRLAEVL